VSNNKGAIASTLGLISTAAQSVTSIFEAAGTGASMLNAYAEKARADQADSITIHRSVYRTNLVRQSALEQDRLEVELESHFNANPGSKERFAATESKLSALFQNADASAAA
jgi:hypothetical protein